MKCLVFFWIFLSPVFLHAQIVITEVMFDPIEAESIDEFIEIYNLSDNQAIDLSGWRLGDTTGEDIIINAGKGLLLLPNQYAVILDPDYFSHSTSYDSLIPDEALVLTVNGMTFGSGGLSNGKSETVQLIDPLGRVVCEYTYSIGNLPGYSDEKIDLSGPDSEHNWQDANVFLGTPGRKNSVFSETVPFFPELLVQPNPFSPDGDGFEDQTVICYHLPFEDASVTIRIFDVCGRMIRNLIPGIISRSENQAVWDGRNDMGQKAEAGMYIVILESLNSKTGTTIYRRTTTVLTSAL